VQQRALAGRVVIDRVRTRVEHAEERRDEVLFGQVLDQLVVHLREDRVEVGAQSQRHAQHPGHLRCAQRRADAVPRSVAQQDEQPVFIERHQVERVASGLVRRAELAGHVVVGEPRHLRGQRAHLDLARELDLAIELLGLQQRPGEPFALDEDDALRREGLGDPLILDAERGVAFPVDDLQHADERRAFDQRHRQHRTHVVVHVEVDRRIERRLPAHVRNVDDLARAGRHAQHALGEFGPYRRDIALAVGQDELALLRLVQPDGRALGAQDAACGLTDLGEHRRQVEGRGQLARDLEDLQQCLRAQPRARGLQLWRHRSSSPETPPHEFARLR
jgi:hypothetical protein